MGTRENALNDHGPTLAVPVKSALYKLNTCTRPQARSVCSLAVTLPFNLKVLDFPEKLP